MGPTKVGWWHHAVHLEVVVQELVVELMALDDGSRVDVVLDVELIPSVGVELIVELMARVDVAPRCSGRACPTPPP